MEAIKGIPYGMSNFTDVMEQNCYYVDKTMYLPLLEDQAHYLIFTRPRRFGKSLFLETWQEANCKMSMETFLLK